MVLFANSLFVTNYVYPSPPQIKLVDKFQEIHNPYWDQAK